MVPIDCETGGEAQKDSESREEILGLTQPPSGFGNAFIVGTGPGWSRSSPICYTEESLGEL